MLTSVVILMILNVCKESTTVYVSSNSNAKKIESESSPAIWTESGIWSSILEDWVISGNYREGRVTQLIPIHDTFVGNETEADKSTEEEKESKISPGTKIVNNGSSVNKKPPPRQISETDMYLLGAIEKLVYRADFMEKRLRRVEEMLYYVMAGSKIDQEPCPDNFYRAGLNCYLFAGTAGRELDWKAANKQCKKYGATLAELETIEENQDVINYIQNQDHLRGREFWTGGLNPGLLWIWSNSARPVKAPNKPSSKNTDPSSSIPGNGRCLRLAYNPPLRSYSYRGSDCATRHSYICEHTENSSSNELRRLGRSRKIIDEL